MELVDFQTSFFCSTQNIIPSVDQTLKILNAYSGIGEQFFPGTFQVNNLDLISNKLSSMTRISLSFPDIKWSLMIPPERVDCNFKPERDVEQKPTINEVIQNSLRIISPLIKAEGLNGSRMAINFKYLLPETEQAQQTLPKILRPFGQYLENPVADFNVYLNTIIPITELGEKEVVNFITAITYGKNLDQSFGNRLLISLDINTLPNNVDSRFTDESLQVFASSVLPLINTQIASIEGIVE